MSNPLKSFTRAIQDATGWSYMRSLQFVRERIEATRAKNKDIQDNQIRHATTVADLVDEATKDKP